MLRWFSRSLSALALITFVHQISTAAPVVPITVGTAGNEPLIVAGPDNTIVITALHHMYASTDGGATFFPVQGPPFAEQANLNSDSSINFDPQGRLYFSFDWPYAGATAVCTTDEITPTPTWTSNPTALPGVTDRMWVIAPSDTAYAVTNEGLYVTTFMTSFDRGLTWVATGNGPGLLEPQTGPLLNDGDLGHVYQVAKNGGEVGLYVYPTPMPGLATYRGSGLAAPLALPSGCFSTDGTLWLSTETRNPTNGYRVVVTRSTDQGQTWTTLPPVPGTMTGTSIFSWVAAGAPGHVGVIYYRTNTSGEAINLTNADWDAMWAETFDAYAAAPHWEVTTLETNVRHGPICIAAGCDGANRFAGDFISSAFDANGKAHLTWMRAVPLDIRYAGVTGTALDVLPAETSSRHWLAAPSPNPARVGTGTMIRFGMAREAEASLALYDLGGRPVREITSGRLPAGEHAARWDGRDARGNAVPNGLYFVRLEVGGEILRSTVVALR